MITRNDFIQLTSLGYDEELLEFYDKNKAFIKDIYEYVRICQKDSIYLQNKFKKYLDEEI